MSPFQGFFAGCFAGGFPGESVGVDVFVDIGTDVFSEVFVGLVIIWTLETVVPRWFRPGCYIAKCFVS